MLTPADDISPTGNAFSIPPRGSNPVTGVGRKPPPLGTSFNVPPAQVLANAKPPWFKGGGPFTGGRLGTETPPKKGAGLSLGGETASPELATDYATGWPTNYWIPYAKIVKDFRHPLMAASQMYQLIITKKEKKDPLNGRKGPEARRYTALNVPSWNYYQALAEKMPSTPDEVLSANDVWRDWTVEGIVRSEEGQADMDFSDERGKERVLNTIVKGYSFVFTGWGNETSNLTSCYLVLKKENVVKEESRGEFTLNPRGQKEVRSLSKSNRTNMTPIPHQLSFWADYRYDYPPDSVLCYEDEFGTRHRGKAIFIGRTERPAVFNPNKRTMSEVNRSLSALLSQPQIFIFLDPTDY